MKDTPTLLIERSVMFRFKIGFVLNYLFEFRKDVNFIVLIENLFGRTRKNVCLISFKLGIYALSDLCLVVRLFAVVVLL